MQTTYRLNANEIDYSFFEKIKELYKNKEIIITIEEVKSHVNQYENLKNQRHLIKSKDLKSYHPTLI